jgi:predicted Rossmann fold flavoprotein
VTPEDYRGGNRRLIRRVLSEFTVAQTVAFFREIGVALHEEAPYGKLFPNTNRARTVLDALLAEAQRCRVEIGEGRRVLAVSRAAHGFQLDTAQGPLRAAAVVLATGGLSLPKSGSDGAGYGFACGLGHSLRPTTPALEPLLLAGDFHRPLSGIAHEAALTLTTPAHKPVTFTGPLLWTHFGISGPAVLDVSGWWRQAMLPGPAHLTINFRPGHTPEMLDAWLMDAVSRQPRSTLAGLLAETLPARVAEAIVLQLGTSPQLTLAHLARPLRQAVVNSLARWPARVTGGRGYTYAEVTAGGIPLEEIDPRTMESRICPGLFLVGEILDVDGRIGGFNFQWAWSSGFVAGRELAVRYPARRP